MTEKTESIPKQIFIWQKINKKEMNFQPILAKIKPTIEEQHAVENLIKEVASKINVKGAKVVLGGSGAKNTWLKGTHDIDLYVAFDYAKYSNQSKELSDLVHQKLKSVFTHVIRLHGSRDYFQVKIKNYTIEIVPILEIKKARDAKNITDVSLLHVRYVKKYTRLADEIRLAKQFAKAQGVYGAESYIKGFSGYVMELLVIHYGSFMKMLRAVSQWKEKTIIGDKQKTRELNEAKVQSPLIFIDPVQPERNAAAAISEEQYKTLIVAGKRFVKKPSLAFFKEQLVNINALKKKGCLTIIGASLVSEKKDVAGAKALKALEWITRQLDEFKVKDHQMVIRDQDLTYYIVTEYAKRPTQRVYSGPPLALGNEQAVMQFKKAHQGATIKKDQKTKRLVAIERQSPQTIQEAVKKLMRSAYVKERIRKPQLTNT